MEMNSSNRQAVQPSRPLMTETEQLLTLSLYSIDAHASYAHCMSNRWPPPTHVSPPSTR